MALSKPERYLPLWAVRPWNSSRNPFLDVAAGPRRLCDGTRGTSTHHLTYEGRKGKVQTQFAV